MGISCSNLTCNYLANPLGVETLNPELGWKLRSDEQNEYQTAFSILVSSTPELLRNNQGDLWDTGKIDSDRNIHIRYAGQRLSSRQKYHWKVMSWDKNGVPSSWSNGAYWEMGMLDPSDWQASSMTTRL